MAVSIKSAH